MSTNLQEVITAARHLAPAEQREVLARLWPKQAAGEIWTSIRFGAAARVVAYAPEQESHLAALRELLQQGALARLENESDGAYEIYGPDRTYYVTMTPAREFAALLSSWLPEQPPREITLQA